MAGNSEGGKKAAAKNLARDPLFYKRIGAKGGKNGHTGGFAANPELARIAGKKGGTISRRGVSMDSLNARRAGKGMRVMHPRDVGQYITYMTIWKSEVGRIKSFSNTNRVAYVIFNADDKLDTDEYTNYTAVQVSYKSLVWGKEGRK